jgi:hypothetical protein
MKKFIRQNATKTPAADIAIDFGAASEQVARVFEPEVYPLQVKTASVLQSRHNGNVFVVFDLVELESGVRVSLQPLWVAGPNAEGSSLVAENHDVIAQMLRQAGLETSGSVGELIPKLAGREFGARLAIYPDSRTGRTFNSIVAIIPEDAA